MRNGCDDTLVLPTDTSINSSTPGSLNLPDFFAAVTCPATSVPAENAVRPFTTTGCVSTPVNRSPVRDSSLERFSLILTLIAVPAGMLHDPEECRCALAREPDIKIA